MTFSPDGSTLASSGDQGKIRLWDADSGQLRATLEPDGMFVFVFSPDGSALVGINGSGIWMWDVASGRLKANHWVLGRELFLGSWAFKATISFSPDGSALAIPGREGTVLLWDMSPPYKIKPIPTVVQSAPPLPEQTALLPNYPNPFNSSTQIPYRVSAPGPVRLVIYNVLGQPVRTLVDEIQAAGAYQVSWDGRNHRGAHVANGIYLYRLQTGEIAQVRKMLVLE